MVGGVHDFVIEFNIPGDFVSETVGLGVDAGLVDDVEVGLTGILLLEGYLNLEECYRREVAFFT